MTARERARRAAQRQRDLRRNDVLMDTTLQEVIEADRTGRPHTVSKRLDRAQRNAGLKWFAARNKGAAS